MSPFNCNEMIYIIMHLTLSNGMKMPNHHNLAHQTDLKMLYFLVSNTIDAFRVARMYFHKRKIPTHLDPLIYDTVFIDV